MSNSLTWKYQWSYHHFCFISKRNFVFSTVRFLNIKVKIVLLYGAKTATTIIENIKYFKTIVYSWYSISVDRILSLTAYYGIEQTNFYLKRKLRKDFGSGLDTLWGTQQTSLWGRHKLGISDAKGEEEGRIVYYVRNSKQTRKRWITTGNGCLGKSWMENVGGRLMLIHEVQQ